jgi:tetratricopeptide (TPR) repeat protein
MKVSENVSMKSEIDAWKAPNADSIYAVQRMHSIGVAAMAVSDHRLAAKMFDEVTKLTPMAVHYVSLGEALGRMGKLEEARKAFEAALRMDPAFVDAWYNMGVMYEQAGKSKEAEECYIKGCEIKETANARNNLANTQRAQLKLAEAEANYRRAQELGYAGAQMNLSLLLMLKGDYVQGLPMFELREKYGSDEAYGPAREMLAILRAAP